MGNYWAHSGPLNYAAALRRSSALHRPPSPPRLLPLRQLQLALTNFFSVAVIPATCRAPPTLSTVPRHDAECVGGCVGGMQRALAAAPTPIGHPVRTAQARRLGTR